MRNHFDNRTAGCGYTRACTLESLKSHEFKHSKKEEKKVRLQVVVKELEKLPKSHSGNGV